MRSSRVMGLILTEGPACVDNILHREHLHETPVNTVDLKNQDRLPDLCIISSQPWRKKRYVE